MKKPCHLLTHSCASSNFRCHKKRAATGDSISRFKVNRPCEETYFKEVARPHSQEAGRLLEKLDLAEKSPGHQTVYRAMKEASAAAFNYDADGGELFSPVNAKFFAMIRRNMNCLLCDKVMSAAYLANFAAGVEERATVTVEGQVIALLMSALKKMADTKISGARLAAGKDAAASENFRLVAASECLWTILELPYVQTSYNSVHVCMLPLEHRGGIIKTERSRFRNSDATVTAFITSRQNSELSVRHKFTESQLIVAQQCLRSAFSINKFSFFGVRPPDLT